MITARTTASLASVIALVMCESLVVPRAGQRSGADRLDQRPRRRAAGLGAAAAAVAS